MRYNLFLDDIRSPSKAGLYMPKNTKHYYYDLLWDIVRNYDEFCAHITKWGLPEIISFDHDLAEIHYKAAIGQESFSYSEKTGYDCMQWMINYIILHKEQPPKKVLVHSMNAVGAENIQKYFNNFLKHYKWDNSKESAILTGK